MWINGGLFRISSWRIVRRRLGRRFGNHRAMGFNRRKMEDQRRQVAEKEAARRRATDAQVLEDAERLRQCSADETSYLLAAHS
jgi:hypothetical protein